MTYSNQNVSSRAVTINKDYPVVHIQFSYNQNCSDFQVEAGSTVTTYETPHSTTYTLHLGDLELAKIGSYQDYIYYDNGKWYKYGAIGKVILNGSESWNFSTYGTKYRASLSVSDIYTSQADNTTSQLYSNYFLKGAYNVADENSVTARYNTPQLNFFITFATSKTEWTTWLGTHNTKVLYPLGTPTSTEITNTTLLSDLEYIRTHAKSYSGTTNISSSGNLPIIISASALKQLS